MLKSFNIPEPFLRYCAVCGKPFKTTHQGKFICGWSCRQERNRQRALAAKHDRRLKSSVKEILIKKPLKQNECNICGFNETIDFHHYAPGKTIALCPNHHSMIHRRLIKILFV